MKTLCLLVVIIGYSNALKTEQMLNGLLVLRPELKPTVDAAIDFYVDYLYGAYPFFDLYFKPPNETITNIEKIFDYIQYDAETFDAAFAALNLNYTNIANYTYEYTPTYSFIVDSGHLVKELLSDVNNRLNNYTQYVLLVSQCGLPPEISYTPWVLTDEQVFDFLPNNGTYNESTFYNILDALNFTGLSDAMQLFSLNDTIIATFVKDYTNNFMELLETLDIDAATLKTALKILAPKDFLFENTIVGSLQEFFESFTAFGSFLQPYKVLTHNSSQFLDVYRNLQEYADLWGTFPPTGNKYHMIINETQRTWMNELNVLNSESVGAYLYQIDKTYNANSYAQCDYPYFLPGTSWEIGFNTLSASYDDSDATLNIPKSGATDIRDGTPLICRDALYGIGSIFRSDDIYWVFDAVAMFVKVIDFMQPLMDVAVETISLVVSTISSAQGATSS